MLERLLSEMEAPEEKRLKRPRRLVACVHNAQRLPAVRELQRREQQGELDVFMSCAAERSQPLAHDSSRC